MKTLPVTTGDTFAFSLKPFEDPRFAAVRVLRTCAGGRGEPPSALVAVTPWLSDRMPTPDDPELRGILMRRWGRRKGRPLISWYEGPLPSTFQRIGTVPPSAEDLAVDPKGSYSGQLSDDIGFEVLIYSTQSEEECEKCRARLRAIRERTRRPATGVRGSMSETEFWRVISMLNWRAQGDDEKVVAPVVAHLATLPAKKIAGFQDRLCEKLHHLDREENAREIGEGAYGAGYFSEDHFLDARCVVVANGKQFYESVIADARKMPKNMEFEVLQSIAEEAYLRKTGVMPVFEVKHDPESCTNEAGWRGQEVEPKTKRRARK